MPFKALRTRARRLWVPDLFSCELGNRPFRRGNPGPQEAAGIADVLFLPLEIAAHFEQEFQVNASLYSHLLEHEDEILG